MPVRLILILTILLCIEGRVLTKKLCYNCGDTIPVNTTGITSDSDICSKINQTEFTTVATNLGLNSQTHVVQTECVKYYKYVINSPSTGHSFISFVVQFTALSKDPSLSPVLVERAGSLPIIWIDNNGNPQQLADDLDLNAYVNKKDYHYIKVNTTGLTPGTTLYVGLYKFTTDKQYYYQGPMEYTITVTDALQCPNDCSGSGNGLCRVDTDICLCVQGRVDLDCSTKAEKIALNVNQNITISSYSWSYFYYVINDDTTDIRLNFAKDRGALRAAMIFNTQTEYDLPNSVVNSGVFNILESQSTDFWVITDATLTKNYGHIMVIGLYNPNEFSIRASFVILQTPDQNPIRTTIMYIMIGVSAALIVLWGIITVLKYKVQRDNEASEASSQQQEEQQDILTPEEMEKFFPQRLFKELKTTFDQPTCTICLEEFQGETICRQIYCEHIFHCKCIESWLSNHKSCPNCKKEVTKNAIEAFLEELEKIKNQINNQQPKMEAKIDHIHLKIIDNPVAKDDRVMSEECKEGDMEERKISFEVKEYMKETDNKKPEHRIHSINSESQLEVNGEMENNKDKNIPMSNEPKDNHNVVINLSNKC